MCPAANQQQGHEEVKAGFAPGKLQEVKPKSEITQIRFAYK